MVYSVAQETNMSLITLGVWIAAVIAFLATGIALLPNGADYPLPQEVVTATQSLYQWLYSLNSIFPVDTLVAVLGYAVLIEIFTKLVWPLIFWIFKTITGGGQ